MSEQNRNSLPCDPQYQPSYCSGGGYVHQIGKPDAVIAPGFNFVLLYSGKCCCSL